MPLPAEGRVIHIRLFMSDAKGATEIDWIEIGAKEGKAKDRQRWDFKQTAKTKEEPR